MCHWRKRTTCETWPLQGLQLWNRKKWEIYRNLKNWRWGNLKNWQLETLDCNILYLNIRALVIPQLLHWARTYLPLLWPDWFVGTFLLNSCRLRQGFFKSVILCPIPYFQRNSANGGFKYCHTCSHSIFHCHSPELPGLGPLLGAPRVQGATTFLMGTCWKLLVTQDGPFGAQLWCTIFTLW